MSLPSTAPRVSVIIPCYNQAHYLQDAIASVFRQNHPNLEIIVVDDGSNDDVRSVTDRYERVQYKRQENRGLSAARNTGLLLSKGEYVLCLDADDRLLPGALEIQTGYLDSRPEAMFVSGQIAMIDAEGRPIATPEEPLITENHHTTLLHYCYIWTSGAVLFRRQVFDLIGDYNASLISTGDWDMYLRITEKFPVICHQGQVLEHRRHDKNMTLDSALMLRESMKVLLNRRDSVRGDAIKIEALRAGFQGIREYYGRPLIHDIRTKIREHEWREAIRAFAVLLRYHPRGILRLLDSSDDKNMNKNHSVREVG